MISLTLPGRFLAIVTLVLAVCPDTHAAIIHDFEFNGTLADSLGGPSLTALGGSLNADGYTFGVNQGLSLSGALTAAQASTYTIDMSFRFDTLSGYRRILDFKNLASDTGLYNLNTSLNFFNDVTGPANAFAPGVYARVVLTRDNANGLLAGYVNGVLQFSILNSGSNSIFDASNRIMYFFQDDVVVGGEVSAGAVNQIRIYDTALTALQVAALGGPKLSAVPEPSTALLASVGLGLVGLIARRSGIGRA